MSLPVNSFTGRAFCLLLLVLVNFAALGADLVGRVVGVPEGDTITVLVDGHDNVKVRLAGIDAPEKAQPYWAVSKRHLSDKVFGRTVSHQMNWQ